MWLRTCVVCSAGLALTDRNTLVTMCDCGNGRGVPLNPSLLEYDTDGNLLHKIKLQLPLHVSTKLRFMDVYGNSIYISDLGECTTDYFGVSHTDYSAWSHAVRCYDVWREMVMWKSKNYRSNCESSHLHFPRSVVSIVLLQFMSRMGRQQFMLSIQPVSAVNSDMKYSDKCVSIIDDAKSCTWYYIEYTLPRFATYPQLRLFIWRPEY